MRVFMDSDEVFSPQSISLYEVEGAGLFSDIEEFNTGKFGATFLETGIIENAVEVADSLEDSNCRVCWDLPLILNFQVGENAFVPNSLNLRVSVDARDLLEAKTLQEQATRHGQILEQQKRSVERAIRNASIARVHSRSAISLNHLHGQRDRINVQLQELQQSVAKVWLNTFEFADITDNLPLHSNDFDFVLNNLMLLGFLDYRNNRSDMASECKNPPSKDSSGVTTLAKSSGRSMGRKFFRDTFISLAVLSLITSPSQKLNAQEVQLSAISVPDAPVSTDVAKALSFQEMKFGIASAPYLAPLIEPGASTESAKSQEEMVRRFEGEVLVAYQNYQSVLNSNERRLSHGEINIRYPFAKAILDGFFASLSGKEDTMVMLDKLSAYLGEHIVYASAFRDEETLKALRGEGDINKALAIIETAYTGNLQSCFDRGVCLCGHYADLFASSTQKIFGVRATRILFPIHNTNISHVMVAVEYKGYIYYYDPSNGGSAQKAIELIFGTPSFRHSEGMFWGRENTITIEEIKKDIHEGLSRTG